MAYSQKPQLVSALCGDTLSGVVWSSLGRPASAPASRVRTMRDDMGICGASICGRAGGAGHAGCCVSPPEPTQPLRRPQPSSGLQLGHTHGLHPCSTVDIATITHAHIAHLF